MLKWKLASISLILFSLLLLPSCGGGGEEQPTPSPVNQAPSVTISGESEYDSGANVQLTASASDSDGSITTYSWSQVSGIPVSLSTVNEGSLNFEAPEVSSDQSFVFAVEVTDNDGATTRVEFTLVILTPNTPPKVFVNGNFIADEGQDVYLIAVVSDDENNIESSIWTQVAGPAVELIETENDGTSFIAPAVTEPQTLTFEIAVADTRGESTKETVSVIVEPVTQSLIEFVIEGDSAEQITFLSSGELGDFTLDGSSQAMLKNIDFENLIIAYDEEEIPLLMSLVQGIGGAAITMNGMTTVESLFSFIPTFSTIFDEHDNIFSEELASLDQIIALARVIEENADWSMDNSAYDLAFDEAVKAAVAKLNTVITESIQPENPKSLQSWRLDTGYTASNGLIDIEVIEYEDTFKINLNNNFYYRWLIAVVTNDPEGTQKLLDINNKDTHILQSKGKLDIVTSKIDLFSYSEGKHITFADPSERQQTGPTGQQFGVYVYGLAVGDFFNKPTKGIGKTAWWTATGYTLLFDFAFNYIAKFSFTAKPCLNWDKSQDFTNSFAENFANSPDIREAITKKNISSFFYEAFKEVSKVVLVNTPEILLCYTKNAVDAANNLARLQRLLGKLSVFLKAADFVVSSAKIFTEHSFADSVTFFPIRNDHEAEINIVSGNYQGVATYSTAEDLTKVSSEVSKWFEGQCDFDEVSPSYICKSYVFTGEPPYSIDIQTTCRNKVTNEIIPCNSGIIEVREAGDDSEEIVSDDYEITEDGKLAFTLQYDYHGELIGTITSYDTVGGKGTLQFFRVQFVKGEPNVITPYFEQREVIDDALVIEGGIAFNTEGEASVTLKNLGYDRATLNYELVGTEGIAGVGPNTLESYFVMDGNVMTVDNPLAEGAVRLSINDEDYSIADGAKLIITGDLSYENIAFTSQKAYSSIEIPITRYVQPFSMIRSERISSGSLLAVPGELYPESLEVRVVDALGTPVEGAIVNWKGYGSARGSGWDMRAHWEETKDDDDYSVDVFTDSEGYASVPWKLGHAPCNEDTESPVMRATLADDYTQTVNFTAQLAPIDERESWTLPFVKSVSVLKLDSKRISVAVTWEDPLGAAEDGCSGVHNVTINENANRNMGDRDFSDFETTRYVIFSFTSDVPESVTVVSQAYFISRMYYVTDERTVGFE